MGGLVNCLLYQILCRISLFSFLDLEFSCHEGGATALGYCRPKQRLFCGGKKGDVCVYDIRQRALLQSISLHSSSINCIVVNDIDGYFVTGSADGDIKVRTCLINFFFLCSKYLHYLFMKLIAYELCSM